jgi:hypothetical protein
VHTLTEAAAAMAAGGDRMDIVAAAVALAWTVVAQAPAHPAQDPDRTGAVQAPSTGSAAQPPSAGGATPPSSSGGTAGKPPPSTSAPRSPAQAATRPPPPKAAQDVARALLPLDRWNRLLDAYASTLTQQLGAAAARGGGKTPEDLEPKLRTQLRDEMRYEDTVDLQARALATTFSSDELKRVAQFYATPLGKKLLADLPEVQSAVSEQLQQKLSQAVPRIIARVAPDALPKGDAAAGGADRGPAHGRTPPAEPKRP